MRFLKKNLLLILYIVSSLHLAYMYVITIAFGIRLIIKDSEP